MSSHHDSVMPEWKIWALAAPVALVVYLVIAGLSLFVGSF